MPRSLDDLIAQADALADRFEQYGPRPGDGDRIDPVTAVRLAALKRLASENELTQAVQTARDAGVSWSTIGESVGTSGEAARQRYGSRRVPHRV